MLYNSILIITLTIFFFKNKHYHIVINYYIMSIIIVYGKVSSTVTHSISELIGNQSAYTLEYDSDLNISHLKEHTEKNIICIREGNFISDITNKVENILQQISIQIIVGFTFDPDNCSKSTGSDFAYLISKSDCHVFCGNDMGILKNPKKVLKLEHPFVCSLYGPMYSRKTKSLRTLINRMERKSVSYVLIKNNLDNRYGISIDEIITHCGKKLKADLVCGSNLNVLINNTTHFEMIKKSEFILIDEGFLFEDIAEFCNYLKSDLKKKVIITHLSGDFKRNPFKTFLPLLKVSDYHFPMKSNCTKCGKEAPFTAKYSGHKDVQIEIGASEKYYPCCRLHHQIM